jgi:quercetin dioxygenase-like cupin family protein
MQLPRHGQIDVVSERTPRSLTGTALAFDLREEARVLRTERPWHEGGHNARTLIKHDGFRLVLVALKPTKRVQEHITCQHVAVHALSGRLRITLPGDAIELAAGGLLGLDRAVPHDIEALEESDLLIWLGWSDD